VIVAHPGVEILDVAGPASVFGGASVRLAETGEPYRVTVAGVGDRLSVQAGVVRVLAERRLDEVQGAIDTLVVPGGLDIGPGPIDPALVAAVRRAARRSKRVASVCSGAFVLGEAGLLDGKRAVTHWAGCALLRERYPTCRVEPDAIFVRDGSLWTSAGVTSGIDLALAMVEEDHGRELALEIARWLVVYLQRPGGQSQFSVPLAAQVAESEPIRETLTWMREHLARDLRVPVLAKRAGMSVRNFARVFQRELGTTPAEHVQMLRLEAARRALETTSRPHKRIAADVGFGTVETLHRVFQRVLAVTPGDYRSAFQARRQRGRRAPR